MDPFILPLAVHEAEGLGAWLLKPRNWIYVAVVGVGLVLAAALLFAGHEHKAAQHADERRAVAQDHADAGVLTVQGQRQSAQQVETFNHLDLTVHQAAATAVAAAQGAPDAKTPLDHDRSQRLRAFDDQLCALRPALCSVGDGGGAAGTVGDATGGPNGMQPAAPADQPHPS